MWRILTSPVFRNCLKTTLFYERLQQSHFFWNPCFTSPRVEPYVGRCECKYICRWSQNTALNNRIFFTLPYVFLCFQHHIYRVTGFVQCFFMPILMSIHSDGHNPTNHALYRTVSGHSFYIFCIEYIWCHNRENCLGNEGASNLNTGGRHRA